MENATGQAVSEDLLTLGKLPSDEELRALIERYAGSARVSCEQADSFFASIGEVVRSRSSAPPQDPAEVARGSWLDKLAPLSSAPPQPATEQLSIAAHVPAPEEPLTIEHGLEHLPAATYSTAPPPSALPSEDTPVALPLSSRPAPQLTAADSVVVERWGMAETAPEPTTDVALDALAQPAEPSAHEAQLSAEEDELLDRWSDELDQTILGQSEHTEHISSAPPPPLEAAHASTDALEHWSAPQLGGEGDPSGQTEHSSSAPPPPPPDAAQHAPTDAPERWSAPQLGGERDESPITVSDDDAPLSETELSLLEQWTAAGPTPPPIPLSSKPAARPPSLSPSQLPPIPSQRPKMPSQLPPIPSSLPPIPSSLRPQARSQPAAAVVAREDDTEQDMELDEAIELDPDDLDLIEEDSE